VWVQGDPVKGTMKSKSLPQVVIERLSQK
jgi:hypothetical protein